MTRHLKRFAGRKRDSALNVPTLATSGTIVLVGYLGPLIVTRKAVACSLIGGTAET